MGTGYTRADTANNIADGNIINASDLDSEYDAIQSAFDASTGHTHDGTAGEGAPIETIGPSQDVVATASVLRPKTDNTVDLGTTSLEYKDLFLDGTAHIDTLDVDENASITGTLGVTGATTLSSTLGVTGATTLSSTLGVTGATTLSSTLGVTGAATLSSTLAVTGATGIDGDFDINTNKFTVASATGNTAVAGTLGVTGATTATGGLNVDTISEITSANGVVIDGVTLKDGGATVTADITFGDNDKVIFGAGSDLQIYHDGSNNSSYIKETGAGSFNIEATNLFLKREGGTENFIDCVTNGAVTAYYDGSPKLATTSTGVNITGTLTSDGLTVSPSGTQQVLATLRANSGSGGGLVVQTDASDDGLIRGYDASGNIQLQFDTDGGDNYIAQGNVGIGNSSPATALDVTGRTTTDNATVGSGTASTYVDLTVNGASTANYGPMIELQSAGTAFGKISNYGRVQGGTSTDMFVTTSTTNNLILGTNNAERMRIDSSGNVGIGTSSPSYPLHEHKVMANI
jgi:fibronectin-binding autotransporter adhesin